MNVSREVGFGVLLGPPFAGDCDLASEWISLGAPNEPQISQLYQISYNCRITGFTSIFTTHLADSESESSEPPIASVSTPIRRVTLMRAIMSYFLNQGLKHVALFYEVSGTQIDIQGQAESISLALSTARNGRQVFELIDYGSLRRGMNMSAVLEPIQDQLDGELSVFYVNFYRTL